MTRAALEQGVWLKIHFSSVNVVHVYEVSEAASDLVGGAPEGRIFIAMEFIAGITLQLRQSPGQRT